MQDGADGGCYSHSSTVFGPRREGYKISLVTRVVLCCLSSGPQGYVDWRTRLGMCCGPPCMRLGSELAQDCARRRCRK
jgi:hypothetical protein